jgi:hypothetical protein
MANESCPGCFDGFAPHRLSPQCVAHLKSELHRRGRTLDLYPFTLTLRDNGMVWIENPDGEAMEVKADTLVAMIEQYWVDNF